MQACDPETSSIPFATRKATARGNWFWEEVDPADWRAAVVACEQVLRDRLADGPAPLAPTPSPTALSLAAYTAGVGPLFGSWIERGVLTADPDSAALLLKHLEHNRIRMVRLAEHAERIITALAAENIGVIVLKGMHLAHHYYDDPAQRPASDIDLLVRPMERFADAERIVAAHGLDAVRRSDHETTFQPTGQVRTPRSAIMAHADDPWAIDLHRMIDQPPAPGLKYTLLGRLLDDARGPSWSVCPAATVLPQPALLLHLAAHAGATMRSSLTLIRMTDIVTVVRRDVAVGTLNWDAFLEAARATDCTALVYPALAMCDRLVPGIIPAHVIAATAAVAPPNVRRLIAESRPATMQRLDSVSVRDYFMWSSRGGDVARQLRAAVVPAMPWRDYPARYGRLFRMLVKGAIQR